MGRFVEGEDRHQATLLPSRLDDYVGEDSAARVVDVFVDELDLMSLGFAVTAAATGRPAYHPATLLKLYIYGYLPDLDTADRQEGEAAEARAGKLKDKIATLRAQMQALKAMETEVAASPDGQVSLTDPDARSMATSGRGSGVVGYNVQSVVETKHHLIVVHEVTNIGSDRSQLSRMTNRARAVIGSEAIEAVADRGYYSGEENLPAS